MPPPARAKGRFSMPRSIPPAGPRIAFKELAAFRHELRLFLQASDGMARRLGLEPQQYHLMLAIKARQRDAETSIKDLADELLLKHHSVVELIDRLEARGLVERHRQAGDRRKVRVTLTPKGERAVATLASRHTDTLRATGGRLAAALDSVLGKPPVRAARSARR
jgi:DNA-binding MarR family transcriptional regulator